MTMMKIINGDLGWDPPLLEQLQAFGWHGERVGFTPNDTDPERWPTNHNILKLGDVLSRGMQPLVITWSADQVSWVPDGCFIEVGNEPNIGTDRQMTAAAYAELAGQILEVAVPRGLRVYVGAVSNVGQTERQYLADVVRLMRRDVPWRGSWHRYAHGETPIVPASGFSSRDDEARAMKAIIGLGREFAITETGYWTAPRCSGFWIFKRCRAWTDEQVAAFAQFEFSFWERHGADFVAWYQIGDDPRQRDPQHRPTKEGTFGIRRLDGTWKPVADQRVAVSV